MVGRNRPCPCGSGRKYKLCCGVEEVRRRDARARVDARFPRSERDLRNQLIRSLLAFVKASFDDRELEAARDRFLGPALRRALESAGADREEEVDALVEIPFHEWLLHDYAPPGGDTVIERYLARHG